MYVEVIRNLINLPASDLNYDAELKRATSRQIAIAVEEMKNNGGKNKGRIAACEKELRRRDRTDA